MNDYIKREDAMKPLYERWKAAESRSDDDIAEIVKMDYITVSNVPSADVVEAGIITCFGIKFVVEDDIIKVKWRHGDKHYIVPFGGLLELWEKYEEEDNEYID